MGTKDTIRFQEKTGDQPGWELYTEMFEKDDAVYLEIEGVQADVTMIKSLWGRPPGTVVLCLPTATARQLGLVPHERTTDRPRSKE
ncbi:hypothetical protein PQQ84_23435 [Paraburkholderia strydomiana]|uniref:hypothetical protein n=1 Tax=Paraburkholderia strydomiana TaxID=1245417 RepID=UPI0038B92AA3